MHASPASYNIYMAQEDDISQSVEEHNFTPEIGIII